MARKYFTTAAAIFVLVACFARQSEAASLTVAWDPAVGATGYYIDWGTSSGNYPNRVTVNGNTSTSYRFGTLNFGTNYFFTVTAFNAMGSSPRTSEVNGVARAADVNQDDHPDVLWQNQTTGALGVWMMNGTGQVAATMLNPIGLTDANWRVVAFADFDKDHYPDMLWRNQATGQLQIWYMQGTTRKSVASVTPNAVTDLAWKIVGVADFDLDGYPDILWRSDVSGTFGIWFMNGATQRLAAMLNPIGFADVAWKVVGVADFDRDGYPDLLWRHDLTGNFGVWFMNGTNMRSAAMLNPIGVSDLAWKVTSVADFDGDGYPDLLWRSDRNGDFGVWYMTGVNLKAKAMFNPTGIADLNWTIVAIH